MTEIKIYSAALCPFAHRGYPFPPGLDRLKQWWNAVAARESVQAIAHPAEFYLDRYARLQR